MYEPPKGLKAAGTALWQHTIDGVEQNWRLDANDLTILERCAAWADDEARLAKRVAEEGDVVEGSSGQPVAHPALRELRMVRSLIVTNIRKVEISRPRARTAHMSKSQRDQLRDARARRWEK